VILVEGNEVERWVRHGEQDWLARAREDGGILGEPLKQDSTLEVVDGSRVCCCLMD
jgi:hypothetical protein